MSYRASLGAGVAVLAWSVATACHAASGVSVVDAAWVKAVKAGDVDAATKCYAADAVAWFPGGPMAKGTQAIHDSYQSWLSTTVIQDAKLTELGSRTIAGSSVAWGTYTLTSVAKTGGSPTIENGRYTEVARKVKGKWVYEVDHASDDPAAAHK